MRLVDDDDGTAESQHVSQRVGHRACVGFFQRGRCSRIESGEVVVKCTGAFVNLATLLFGDAEGLQRADDHDRTRIECRLGDVERLGGLDDLHRAKFGFERLTVVMGAVAQRGKGLVLDCTRRHEPKHYGAVALQQLALDYRHTEAGEQRLAAAGRSRKQT